MYSTAVLGNTIQRGRRAGSVLERPLADGGRGLGNALGRPLAYDVRGLGDFHGRPFAHDGRDLGRLLAHDGRSLVDGIARPSDTTYYSSYP